MPKIVELSSSGNVFVDECRRILPYHRCPVGSEIAAFDTKNHPGKYDQFDRHQIHPFDKRGAVCMQLMDLSSFTQTWNGLTSRENQTSHSVTILLIIVSCFVGRFQPERNIRNISNFSIIRDHVSSVMLKVSFRSMHDRTWHKEVDASNRSVRHVPLS